MDLRSYRSRVEDILLKLEVAEPGSPMPFEVAPAVAELEILLDVCHQEGYERGEWDMYYTIMGESVEED